MISTCPYIIKKNEYGHWTLVNTKNNHAISCDSKNHAKEALMEALASDLGYDLIEIAPGSVICINRVS
jgi:hypothetical protein